MSRPDGLRLALAQPTIDPEAGEEARVNRAVGMIAQAGQQRADLVLFPESYPGPITAGASYDAEEAVAAACRDAGTAACWGRVEGDEKGGFATVAYLTGRNGRRLERYVRSHPATGDVHPVLSGSAMVPGNELGLFEFEGLKLGVTICSELWSPEICRSLALLGAEVLLAPAGGGFHRVAANWQLIARARAIENELFVGLTQQLFEGETGSALIAGPESVAGELTEPGLLIRDLDLTRSRWLRDHDDSMQEPKLFSSLPGLLRARRPGLYQALVEPAEDDYDFEADPD